MPVVVWIVVAVALGLISLIGGLALDRWLRTPSLIALIGQPGAGKSTFLYVLENGDIPARGFEPTIESHRSEATIENKTFWVLDSPGDQLDEWVKNVKKAAGVIYFFDVSLVLDGDADALSAVDADADHIEALFRRPSSSRRFTIVGTHSDLVPDKPDLQSLREVPAVRRLVAACGAGSDAMLVGSLADKKSAVRLATQVAKHQSKS